MARLTKYSSFKALKSGTSSNQDKLTESDKLHAAFERFITALQEEARKKQVINADKIEKR